MSLTAFRSFLFQPTLYKAACLAESGTRLPEGDEYHEEIRPRGEWIGVYSRCSGKPKRKSRVILVLAVPMIVTPTRFQETAGRFLANGPLVLISGVLAMVAELSIANTHNVWIVDWTLIVTVFGWALVLGGASRIIAPQVVRDVGSPMMGRPTMTRVICTFWALLGAFLTFKVYA